MKYLEKYYSEIASSDYWKAVKNVEKLLRTDILLNSQMLQDLDANSLCVLFDRKWADYELHMEDPQYLHNYEVVRREMSLRDYI